MSTTHHEDDARDGFTGEHVSPLTLELLAAGETVPDGVRDHLDSCLVCHRALSALRDHQAQVQIAPRADVRQAAGGGVAGGSGRGMLIAGGLLTLAAAAALFVLSRSAPTEDPGGLVPPTPDQFRLKGGFDLEVFARGTGDTAERLDDGSEVKPGQPIGFRISNRDVGFLLIAGVDGKGETYAVYPADGSAGKMRVSEQPRPLDRAIAFDDVPGSETLVALFCREPISLAQVSGALQSGREAGFTTPVHPSCQQRVMRLNKGGAGAGR